MPTKGGAGKDNEVYVPSLNVADEYVLPLLDGADGQVMTTDGAGRITFKNATGGGNVSTSGTPVTNDYARFSDATHIEGRDYNDVKSDLGFMSSSGDTMSGDIDMDGNTLQNVEQLIFDTTPSSPGNSEGTTYWDTIEQTLNVVLEDNSVVMRTGQETLVRAYNGSGTQIDKGTVVSPIGIFNGVPSLVKSIASVFESLSVEIGMAIMDIPDGEYGFYSRAGKVRGLNTSGYTVADLIWVSDTIVGGFTKDKPSFPSFPILLGVIAVVDETDGELYIDIKGSISETTANFFNGIFRESFDLRVLSNGSTITGYLSPTNGHEDLTMMFSDGFTRFDATPPATITLTPGTNNNPQTNYIYVPQSTKSLTVSPSGWPTAEHIRVARVALKTAATVKAEGASRNQNWNDEIQDAETNQGHLTDITSNIRSKAAQYVSGAKTSVTIAGGGQVYVKSTGGIVQQLHNHVFPQLDMTQYVIDAVSTSNKTFTISNDGDLSSTFPDGRIIKINNSTGNNGLYTIASSVWATPNFIITVDNVIPSGTPGGTIGDYIEVINDFSTSYRSVLNLATITTDASGNPLNNTSFSIVVFGVQNKTGEPSHLCANMPLGTYSKNFPELAIEDANASTVYSTPQLYEGVSFLMALLTFINTSGVWSLYSNKDLTGLLPNTTAGGGGGGGGGVTTFLGLSDTPNAYVDKANNLTKVNAGATALEFFNPTTDWLAQYIMAAGRAGGQTLSGGTAAGDDLTLKSTSDPTKGDLLFGAAGNSKYDEANDAWRFQPAVDSTTFLQVLDADGGAPVLDVDSTNERVGIGTGAPLSTLHINGGTGALANGLSFGDGDSGVYESFDDTLQFVTAGVSQLSFASNQVSFFGSGSVSFYINTSQSDDGVHFAPRNLNGIGNRNFIFAEWDSVAKDYDHDTLSPHPTVFFQSSTNPDTNNTEWGSLSFVGTGAGDGYFNVVTGTGDVALQPVGNVSIGHAAPTAKLHVVGTSDTEQLLVQSNATQNDDVAQIGDVSAGNYTSIQDDGDVRFVGTAGLPYGSLYLHEGTSNVDISAVGQGVYVKITGLTTGLLNNVTINSDAFNVGTVGVYKIDWQISGDSQGLNKDYEVDIFVNGVEQEDGSSRREFAAVASLGSMSGSGLIDITNTGHDIDLRMKEVGAGAGTDFDIFNMNFNVLHIGGRLPV